MWPYRCTIFRILIIVFFCGACHYGKSVSFDAASWRGDKEGCKGKRIELFKSVIENRDELLGLNNRQIINLLGMPDRNELYDRNQKFFVYHVSPAPGCEKPYMGEVLFLFVRFNAVGLAQEVFIEKDPEILGLFKTKRGGSDYPGFVSQSGFPDF